MLTTPQRKGDMIRVMPFEIPLYLGCLPLLLKHVGAFVAIGLGLGTTNLAYVALATSIISAILALVVLTNWLRQTCLSATITGITKPSAKNKKVERAGRPIGRGKDRKKKTPEVAPGEKIFFETGALSTSNAESGQFAPAADEYDDSDDDIPAADENDDVPAASDYDDSDYEVEDQGYRQAFNFAPPAETATQLREDSNDTYGVLPPAAENEDGFGFGAPDPNEDGFGFGAPDFWEEKMVGLMDRKTCQEKIKQAGIDAGGETARVGDFLVRKSTNASASDGETTTVITLWAAAITQPLHRGEAKRNATFISRILKERIPGKLYSISNKNDDYEAESFRDLIQQFLDNEKLARKALSSKIVAY